MLKPIFDFDYFGLPVYNLMAAIGALCALVVLLKKEKVAGLSVKAEEKLNFSLLAGGVLSLVSANVANWFLFYPKSFQVSFLQRIQTSGFSFYYGMFGFFAVFALLLKIYKLDVKHWLNEIVPSVLIFHAFGRVGCALVGCCYGKDIASSFKILKWHISSFPARELESLCLFILFFVFEFLVKKHRFKLYLLSYSVLRLLLEFGRGDDRGFLLVSFLSPAQVTSIFVWIGIVAFEIFTKLYSLVMKNESGR